MTKVKLIALVLLLGAVTSMIGCDFVGSNQSEPSTETLDELRESLNDPPPLFYRVPQDTSRHGVIRGDTTGYP